ncbi:hypothetical protein BHM03_00013793 [Ensete ventricosum]|nr:hypothetical protein BHM03_00013793 [Ensete ventricosum]
MRSNLNPPGEKQIKARFRNLEAGARRSYLLKGSMLMAAEGRRRSTDPTEGIRLVIAEGGSGSDHWLGGAFRRAIEKRDDCRSPSRSQTIRFERSHNTRLSQR